MPLKKIVVLVSGSGTNLQCLIDKIHNKYAQIVAVISDVPDAYALKRAENTGIAAKTFDYRSYQNKNLFYDDMLIYINKIEPDLIVLAGFLKILPEKFYNEYKNRIMNIHPSLIPAFCGKGYYGLKVHQAVIDYGVKITGVTVHFADAGADTGPVILQKAVEVFQDDTAETLQKRVLGTEHELLPEAVKLFVQQKLEIIGRKVYIKKSEAHND